MTKEKIEELINKQYSSYKIGIELGISQSYTMHLIRKYGLKLNSKRSKYSSEEKKKLRYQRNTHAQRNRGVVRKREFVEKMGGKCCKCGYDKNYSALDFHHLDETKKVITLDVCSLGHFSIQKCEDELKKCILICANCHREVHHPDMFKIGGAGAI